MIKTCGTIIFCFVTMLLTGCGSDVAEFKGTLIPVKGKVTINDTPEEGVSVAFIPDKNSQTAGTGAYGITDNTGAFVLKHRTDKEGIEAGNYKVTFSKYTMPDGTAYSGDTNPEAAGASQSIPRQYSSAEKTLSNVTVSTDKNDFTFELKFKKK